MTDHVDNDLQEMISFRLPWNLLTYLKKEAGAKGVTYIDLIRVAIFAAYPQFANSLFQRRMERAERLTGDKGGKWEYRKSEGENKADEILEVFDKVPVVPTVGKGAKIVKTEEDDNE
jgi:hypothetical protein